MPAWGFATVVASTVDGLAEGDTDVEIWLPYQETTALADLRAAAPVEPMHLAFRIGVEHFDRGKARFDADGRCAEYREWYMRKPKPEDG